MIQNRDSTSSNSFNVGDYVVAKQDRSIIGSIVDKNPFEDCYGLNIDGKYIRYHKDAICAATLDEIAIKFYKYKVGQHVGVKLCKTTTDHGVIIEISSDHYYVVNVDSTEITVHESDIWPLGATENKIENAEWKKGDILPIAFLKKIKLYFIDNNLRFDNTSFSNKADRQVDKIVNGKIYVSNTKLYFLASEHLKNNIYFSLIQSQSKTQENEKLKSNISSNTNKDSSNCNIRKTSDATYLPGNQERIATGQRRKGIAIRG